ncbi:hypothetical protein [Maribacter sp. HTCC2170]|uniref:hypothetical protein n=1 Tax=Maribacter sp. (strain HTCC2170 / KCCM 42371) TaxID=313603 RepID=UPI00006B478B|nr:hypothetical protein [Maribacter sp. HTCC2170]EAR01993.1 hypothetical protein FB2170_15733 [Maribacter sp. HTCC2170]
MKAIKRFKSKPKFLSHLAIIFIFSLVIPIQAQVERDGKDTKIKVREHRRTKIKISKNPVLNFDEADAIFGKRTDIQSKYPGLKFIGNVKQIKIIKKLSNGENYIYKTTTGDKIYASVKKGEITKISLRNPKIKDGTSNTIAYSDNNSTCFNCTELCHDPDGAGKTTCWTTCVIVDCTKEHNAKIPGKIVKGN